MQFDRLPDASDRVGIFSVRNAVVTAFSLIFGVSLLALLLTLISQSGILDRLSGQADFTVQSVESFDIKSLLPSPEAVSPTSPSQTSAPPLAVLSSAPTTRAVEAAAIPAPSGHFTKLAVLDSLSHSTNLLIPEIFEPEQQQEKSDEKSDLKPKDNPKGKNQQPSKEASSVTTKQSSGETPKRSSDKSPGGSAQPPAAKSHYGASELDGTPRLVRHGSTDFPTSLSRKGVSRGTVVLEVELSTSGSVSVRRVISSTHPELVAPARRVASGARFTPPKRNGQTVNAILRWPIIIEK